MTPPHDDLRALAAKATPGPWEIREDSCNGKDEEYCHWHEVGPLHLMGKQPDADGQYIAAANPTRITALLDEHAGLRAENARLREVLKGLPKRAIHSVTLWTSPHGPTYHEPALLVSTLQEVIAAALSTPPPVATTREGRPKFNPFEFDALNADEE